MPVFAPMHVFFVWILGIEIVDFRISDFRISDFRIFEFSDLDLCIFPHTVIRARPGIPLGSRSLGESFVWGVDRFPAWAPAEARMLPRQVRLLIRSGDLGCLVNWITWHNLLILGFSDFRSFRFGMWIS